MPTPPPETILDLIRARYQDLLGSERAFRFDIQSFFGGLLPDFKREIEDHFLRHFLSNVDEDGHSIWDGAQARQLGTVEEIGDSYAELTDAMAEGLEPLFDETLSDGFDDGYLTGLWELALMGADLGDIAPPPMDFASKALLTAAGFGGVGYMDRVTGWLGIGGDKLTQWMKGATASGMTLDQTMQGVNGILNTMVGRVEGLGGNEFHRALLIGQQNSWEPYRSLKLGEWWLTMKDGLVCPYCASLHMHVTDLDPQVDSHPNCRCWKVPIILGENFVPQDYNGWVATVQNTLEA